MAGLFNKGEIIRVHEQETSQCAMSERYASLATSSPVLKLCTGLCYVRYNMFEIDSQSSVAIYSKDKILLSNWSIETKLMRSSTSLTASSNPSTEFHRQNTGHLHIHRGVYSHSCLKASLHWPAYKAGLFRERWKPQDVSFSYTDRNSKLSMSCSRQLQRVLLGSIRKREESFSPLISPCFGTPLGRKVKYSF